MNRWLSVVGIAGVILLLSLPVQADVYVFKDAAGDRRFSDNCPQRRCKLFLKTRMSKAPPPKRSGYRGRHGSTRGNYSYYTYYSRALLGYPALRSTERPSLQPIDPVGGVLASTTLRVIDRASRKRYAPQIEQIARTYGLDSKLIHAVISAESAYDPAAVSNKGAMGLMQLMPDTARRFGVTDPFDPTANMHGGARYLRWLMDRFQNNLNLVLAAYNAGEGAVERYGNAIPPYEETRIYVARVLDYYHSSRSLN